MKKTIIAFTLLIIISFATIFALPAAVAAPLKPARSIEVALYGFQGSSGEDTLTEMATGLCPVF
jgi:hypothetical protein